MPEGRLEEHQQFPINAKCRDLITDALFSPGSRISDSLSQFLERRSLLKYGQGIVTGIELRFRALIHALGIDNRQPSEINLAFTLKEQLVL